MEAFAPYIPLTLAVIVIVIIVRWRKSRRAAKPEPVSKAKRAISPQPTRPAPPNKPAAAEERFTVYCAVQLVKLDTELAKDLEGTRSIPIHLDEDAVLNDSGPIAVVAESGTGFRKTSDTLGYLPSEIADEIRATDIAHQLAAEIGEIWVGDHGGAIVRIDLLGAKEHKIKLLEHEINSRRQKKTINKGELRGHPTHVYTADRLLLELREDWGAYEALLKELIEADLAGPENSPAFHIGELAKFYRKQKRYADEVSLLTNFQGALKSRGEELPDRLASRLRKSTQLANKPAT